MENQLRLGIDLGGTKTEVIVLSRDGETLFRDRVETVRDDYQATLATVKALVDKAEQTVEQQCTIGIGTPGAISPQTGLLKNSNSIWLNGKPLQQDLEQILQRPVRLANDANCFALSEAVDGAAAQCNVVFGVIVGTGTGAGVVVNKTVHVGPNAIAGEWGHNPMPWPHADEMPGPECYCGKRGCIETFLSGPGMALDFYEMTGIQLTSAEIVQQASKGDENATIIVNRYEERLAKSLASVINVLDPDAIVLGGGMSNIERLYENVPRRWDKYVFSDSVNTLLLPPQFGDSSGVRGAAWLW
ncbi:MAG: ROK family protein [Gammaproteobacteria bacterium]|jgi:fructokinase